MPFIMRTCMIYFMGVEYLGLDTLFASVLQVLNLAELGVGSAMVYSMYRPIAEDDHPTICALLRLYRIHYRIIGIVILVCGLALTPAIPYLVKGNIPAELNIYVLYWINLGFTSLSYWLFAYKNSLLQAYQRADVVSKVSIGTSTLQYALRLFIIFVLKDYYLYILATLAAQVLTNVVCAVCATRMFPYLKPAGSLAPEERKAISRRIRDLFTARIGGVVVNSADTIVISAFLGLSMLAVYQNYFYVVTAVTGLLGLIFSAALAGIGNSLATEPKEKNFRDLERLTFAVAWLAGACVCCMLCLYQPFMEVWVGEALMLEYPAVVFFCLYFYIQEINTLLNTYKDAGGIWHKDRFRPLAVSAANLALNLVLVQFWGVYGVLASTFLVTLVIGMPWLLFNLFTCLFEWECLKGYVCAIAKFAAAAVVAAALCVFVCSVAGLSGWCALGFNLVVCLVVPNALFFVLFKKRPEFAYLAALANRFTFGKIGPLQKWAGKE